MRTRSLNVGCKLLHSNAHRKCFTSAVRRNESKFYLLVMFPYPSGTLHVGHFRVYTIADVLARYRRLLGSKLIFPMGWDAFGLPAENAAIQHRVAPATWTQDNITKMKAQMLKMGTSFDWNRELSTCDPEFYRWTQFIFIEMYKAGLAYQKEALVNWDPVDCTVLANEQVDDEGRAERSGAVVEKKLLRQWFLKISEYTESLLGGLDTIEWPSNVKQLQKNWIGKSSGLQFDFKLSDSIGLSVFTTRPDTVNEVEFVCVSPYHPLLDSCIPASHSKEVCEFLVSARKCALHDDPTAMKGIWTGLTAASPFTGRKVPVYIGTYVDAQYATGAVMGVPAHDERDRRFASLMGIEISLNGAESSVMRSRKELADDAFRKAEQAGFGKAVTQYRLRDWLISRQRLWGTPIPIIHCTSCGTMPVPDNQLPVTFPSDMPMHDYAERDSVVNEWAKCQCPKCKGPALRETDTMDTFVDSSWYWVRYLDPKNSKQLCSPEIAKDDLPVDLYVGGVEHAILHLLYARFVYKFLTDRGFIPNHSPDHAVGNEPFKRLFSQGMVQGKTYKCPDSGRYLRISDLDLTDGDTPRIRSTGLLAKVSWEKMSKSKYNGVNPEEVIDEHGLDAARLYVLHKAAPQDELMWDSRAILGVQRFMERIRKLVKQRTEQTSPKKPKSGNRVTFSDEAIDLRLHVHRTLDLVTEAFESTYLLNQAISDLIKLSQRLEKSAAHLHSASQENSDYSTWLRAYDEGLFILLRMMQPFAPKMASEAWETLCLLDSTFPRSIGQAGWPKVDEHALVEVMETCVVMVNGRKVDALRVSKDVMQREPDLIELARKRLSSPALQQKPKRIVVANGGKVVNFVF
ncbi:leucyl-tRNA synthetase [Cladochytrium replicatum]|nr:leucyl-tRNA synthetase [Cladochytrium replicatum]